LISFRKAVTKIQVSIKSDKSNGTSHEDQHTFFYHISINSSHNEKCFRQKL